MTKGQTQTITVIRQSLALGNIMHASRLFDAMWRSATDRQQAEIRKALPEIQVADKITDLL